MENKQIKTKLYGKKQLKTMLIAALLFFISACMVANTTNTVLPFFAQVRGWNVSILMMMAGIALLISVVFAIFLGRLTAKIGPKKVIITTLVLGAGSVLLYGFTKHMGVFIFAIILNAIFATGYQTVGVTALINNWFPRKKGIILGWVTMGIIASLIVGAICGWLAGIIMKSKNGLLMNIILGIAGGFVGGWVFGLLGFGITGLLGNIISGVVGACIVIFLARLVGKKK